MINSNSYSNASWHSTEKETFSRGKDTSASSDIIDSKNSSHSEHSDAEKENQPNISCPANTANNKFSFVSESSKNMASDNSAPTLSLFQRILQETQNELGMKNPTHSQPYRPNFYPYSTSERSSSYQPNPFASAYPSSSYQPLPFASAHPSLSSSLHTTCLSNNSIAPKRKADEKQELNPQEKRKKTAEKVQRAQQNLVAVREETIRMGRKIDQFAQSLRNVHPSTTVPSCEIIPVKLNPPEKLSKKEIEIMHEEKLTEQAQRIQKRILTVMDIALNEVVEIITHGQQVVEKSHQLEERNVQLELENAKLLKLLSEHKIAYLLQP